jgi:membrane associated rhomboid family serine protease
MIVRIADESSSTERMPWLTLGLMAAILASFFLARGQQPFSGDGELVKLEHAVDYWLERPYLEPEPAVIDAAAHAAGSTDAAAFVAGARERGPAPPPDAEALEQEQTGLVYLTRLALRGSDASPGPAHPFQRFGLKASAPRAHALIAHLFLHAGWIHLGLTLLVLWLLGPALESRLGRPIFAGLCLASGLAAAVTHLIGSPGSTAPLIGASGIAAGMVGAFGVRFAAGRVHVHYFALRAFRPTAVALEVSIWALVPVAIVVQLAFSLLFMDSEVAAGSDWAAHLAGLGFGGAFAFALQRLSIEKRIATRSREARTRAKLDPRLERALTARERGKHAEAIELAAVVLRERPDDADALQMSWDAHVAAGRAGDGARSARRLIELLVRRGDLANAARLWDELVRVGHRSPVAATTLLRIVPELVVQARRDAAIAALRAVVDPANAGLSIAQALRVAELATELDPPTALRAARFALRSAELLEEWRARLKQLVLSLESAGVQVEALAESDASPQPQTPSAPEPEDLSISEYLSLPEEVSTQAIDLPLQPAELFDVKPTQLSIDEPLPVSAPPAPVIATPLAENYATVVFAAPPASRSDSATVKITPAQPVALDVAGLRVRLEGGAPSLIEWTHIQAVGVGLVSGLGPNPLVVIDLALNWADALEGGLEVTRLRSDGFRARQLVTGTENALDALRALLAELLARSGAVPLPDAAGAHGLPFREYASPEVYQSEVLLA